ncbi:hypothetical protein [Draconibacterium sediminis]|uniref:Uncharacterized protein n=1 Tax=Draconibacterium sediminis TaxID=1544798 RepID=A0A0D8J8E1_9BACT|nr:hypothetical protein [Draconibacterium sediminis]KJF43230.1 hypothetical protein LH29_13315 [Draconibacterium sediminis]
MRTILNINEYAQNQAIHLEKINDSSNQVEIAEVNYTPESNLELLLQSPLFIRSPRNIKIAGDRLTLTLEEFVRADYPDRAPEFAWASFFYHSYVRFHHISFLLPGDDFYMIKSALLPEAIYLKIVLGMAD